MSERHKGTAYGRFDDPAHEYVIERPDVPVSWTNYLGTRDFCTVISHHGGGYSYYRSAQTGRITRFRQNGVPLDRPGKYVYLRDAAANAGAGDHWSISWQPVGKPFVGPSDDVPTDGSAGRWTSAHGTGYTRFESSFRGIDATQTVFVPLDDDAEVWDVRLTNTTPEPRTLTVTGYVEFSFHTITVDNQNLQMSLYSQGADYADGVVEVDAYYEPWTFHYFASAGPSGETADSFDALRDAFVGPYRDESDPRGVAAGALSGSQGTTQNHCGALAHEVTIAPGSTVRLSFVLGYGSRDAVGRAMRAKFADPAVVDAEYTALVDHWRAKQARLAVTTPHAGMNSMLNTWTLLQAETCVVWSRFASFVEVGGRTGLGYRDTAQDCMSVIHSNPVKSKQRIVELLRAQTEAGYGLHLFDPADFDPDAPQLPDIPSPTIVPRTDRASLIHGLEDTCSDDHLWLVPTIAEYVKETGETDFLDQEITYAEGSTGTVWEHLERALDFTSQQVGANGVALGLRADWNDGINLGGGETALVTFLHAWAIRAYLSLAGPLGRHDHVARYEAELDRLAAVADKELWDGRWWRRGITRDGVLIGSADNAEGKIFLEHQAWPVIGGITTRERGIQSMDAVHELLASEYGNHLSWPAFTQVDDTVGFLTRVYPGIKENAAIFSHPNAWPIIAEAMLGRGDEAMAFYDAILPYHQNDNVEVREAEPYAYVQFVYGRDHERFGLAQNPWLTGSSGWMYTAATKYILGVRPSLDGLVIDPAIPAAWDGFEVRREWRGAVYEIAVRNPEHVQKGVRSVVVDGVALPAGTTAVPVVAAGTTVRVEVTLG
ncbi:GH36-type glycosyl hydrolase domain-containing protein [Xylanimonas protaetiae]|uniref:N,N'-diacetylchitobiose phosphorylase n=1 Tax=Xylanimonas protaetiae TaxID=2509457 RepID=A0A4P6F508_9MICO|nr:N,N'-diacetylchitobiose phosphorylase [Xylanimonas protaetiae]QAY70415.1 N,N'-diacetylchitobiose phosphorylase [Xylanimonas protaetiae]